jgi:hypothetical protein
MGARELRKLRNTQPTVGVGSVALMVDLKTCWSAKAA